MASIKIYYIFHHNPFVYTTLHQTDLRSKNSSRQSIVTCSHENILLQRQTSEPNPQTSSNFVFDPMLHQKLIRDKQAQMSPNNHPAYYHPPTGPPQKSGMPSSINRDPHCLVQTQLSPSYVTDQTNNSSIKVHNSEHHIMTDFYDSMDGFQDSNLNLNEISEDSQQNELQLHRQLSHQQPNLLNFKDHQPQSINNFECVEDPNELDNLYSPVSKNYQEDATVLPQNHGNFDEITVTQLTINHEDALSTEATESKHQIRSLNKSAPKIEELAEEVDSREEESDPPAVENQESASEVNEKASQKSEPEEVEGEQNFLPPVTLIKSATNMSQSPVKSNKLKKKNSTSNSPPGLFSKKTTFDKTCDENNDENNNFFKDQTSPEISHPLPSMLENFNQKKMSVILEKDKESSVNSQIFEESDLEKLNTMDPSPKSTKSQLSQNHEKDPNSTSQLVTYNITRTEILVEDPDSPVLIDSKKRNLKHRIFAAEVQEVAYTPETFNPQANAETGATGSLQDGKPQQNDISVASGIFASYTNSSPNIIEVVVDSPVLPQNRKNLQIHSITTQNYNAAKNFFETNQQNASDMIMPILPQNTTSYLSSSQQKNEMSEPSDSNKIRPEPSMQVSYPTPTATTSIPTIESSSKTSHLHPENVNKLISAFENPNQMQRDSNLTPDHENFFDGGSNISGTTASTAIPNNKSTDDSSKLEAKTLNSGHVNTSGRFPGGKKPAYGPTRLDLAQTGSANELDAILQKQQLAAEGRVNNNQTLSRSSSEDKLELNHIKEKQHMNKMVSIFEKASKKFGSSAEICEDMENQGIVVSPESYEKIDAEASQVISEGMFEESPEASGTLKHATSISNLEITRKDSCTRQIRPKLMLQHQASINEKRTSVQSVQSKDSNNQTVISNKTPNTPDTPENLKLRQAITPTPPKFNLTSSEDHTMNPEQVETTLVTVSAFEKEKLHQQPSANTSVAGGQIKHDFSRSNSNLPGTYPFNDDENTPYDQFSPSHLAHHGQTLQIHGQQLQLKLAPLDTDQQSIYSSDKNTDKNTFIRNLNNSNQSKITDGEGENNSSNPTQGLLDNNNTESPNYETVINQQHGQESLNHTLEDILHESGSVKPRNRPNFSKESLLNDPEPEVEENSITSTGHNQTQIYNSSKQFSLNHSSKKLSITKKSVSQSVKYFNKPKINLSDRKINRAVSISYYPKNSGDEIQEISVKSITEEEMNQIEVQSLKSLASKLSENLEGSALDVTASPHQTALIRSVNQSLVSRESVRSNHTYCRRKSTRLNQKPVTPGEEGLKVKAANNIPDLTKKEGSMTDSIAGDTDRSQTGVGKFASRRPSSGLGMKIG